MFVEICIRFLVLSAAIRTAALRETTANEACTFKKDGFFYDSRVSQYSRWIVEKKLNVSKEADCGSECCLSGRNCTLYVFSQRNLTPNCVVISCHNNTECFENLLSEKRSGRHFVRVGIRDNINITSPHSSSSTSTTGQVSRITAPIASQLLNKQPNDTGGIQNSSSDKQDDPTKKPSEQTQFITHSHTTPASLVISLIIGILFFGAVVFLIGRRWGEVCYRKGYSRVDYLLNDYE